MHLVSDNKLPENYDALPERQRHVIDEAIGIQQLPEGCAFTQDFDPANKAITFLAMLAQRTSAFADQAAAILKEWRSALASPEDIARAHTDDEHELRQGCLISDAREEGGGGYWLSGWIWVDHRPGDKHKEPTPEELAVMEAKMAEWRRKAEINMLRQLAQRYPEITKELQTGG